jgi:hypothetical protein
LNVNELFTRHKPEPLVVTGDQILALCREGKNITNLERVTGRNGFWKVTIKNEHQSNNGQHDSNRGGDAG